MSKAGVSKWLLICGFLVLSGCTGKKGETTNPSQDDLFKTLQAEYFSRLDFRVDEERLNRIPPFEEQFHLLSEIEKQDLEKGTADKERAGLIFIYDALMTLNNTYGVMDGTFRLEQFTKYRRFAPGKDENEEKIARAKYAQNLLASAAKLRPNDRRIDSWIVGAAGQAEKLEKGFVSVETLNKVMDSIPVRPTFNLWTSILMMQNLDAHSKEFDRLTQEAKKFVDAIQAGNDPCKDRPKDCENSPNAVYNSQASLTVLGDVFLRRAEWEFKEKNIPRAMELASYAKGTFAQLEKADKVATTNSWPDKAVLGIRKDHVGQVLQQQETKEDLRMTAGYARPYECASCHGRAN